MAAHTCLWIGLGEGGEHSLGGCWEGGGGRGKPSQQFLRSLDSDQKDQLIEVIEKLLADKTTVRIGYTGGVVGRCWTEALLPFP